MKAYKLSPDEWALINLARRYNLDPQKVLAVRYYLDPQKVLAVAIDSLIAEPGVIASHILTAWERVQIQVKMCNSMPMAECFKYEMCGAGCPAYKLREGDK